MPVIALGGLTAGGGRIIGPMVAKKLKIDYVDKADISISREWINKDNLSILSFNN